MRRSFAFIIFCLLAGAVSPLRADDAIVLVNPPPGQLNALMQQAHSVYDPYIKAEKAHNFAAISALLTPDFTMQVQSSKQTHAQSLNTLRQITGLVSDFNAYQLTIEKMTVSGDRATVIVKERFSGLPPGLKNNDTYEVEGYKSTISSFAYDWTHHWVKTVQGWRLKSMERGTNLELTGKSLTKRKPV